MFQDLSSYLFEIIIRCPTRPESSTVSPPGLNKMSSDAQSLEEIGRAAQAPLLNGKLAEGGKKQAEPQTDIHKHTRQAVGSEAVATRTHTHTEGRHKNHLGYFRNQELFWFNRRIGIIRTRARIPEQDLRISNCSRSPRERCFYFPYPGEKLMESCSSDD